MAAVFFDVATGLGRTFLTNGASSSGVVRGVLCDKDIFLKTCAMTASEKANGEQVTLVFKDVPPGRYAFNAYHDENANGK